MTPKIHNRKTQHPINTTFKRRFNYFLVLISPILVASSQILLKKGYKIILIKVLLSRTLIGI